MRACVRRDERVVSGTPDDRGAPTQHRPNAGRNKNHRLRRPKRARRRPIAVRATYEHYRPPHAKNGSKIPDSTAQLVSALLPNREPDAVGPAAIRVAAAQLQLVSSEYLA